MTPFCSLQDSVKLVKDGKADIMAGVVGLLEKEASNLDAKILPGHFMTVPQVGTLEIVYRVTG